MAETLLEVSGKSADIEFAPARPGELLRSALDTTRARGIGWAPEVDLAEGLRRTYHHISEHL